MNSFNINNVIEHYGLNAEEIAKLLFPNVKYPELALKRVLKGEANLDTAQLCQLANHIGVPVSSLITLPDSDWRGQADDGDLIFVKGEFKVKLNYKGTFLTIYKSDKVVDQVIIGPSTITLSDFIEYLDILIKNY